jgi:hypothetical protein
MENLTKNITPPVLSHHGEFAPIQIIKAAGGVPLLNPMKEEVFVAINGYEGSYEISNYGRVKSLTKSWMANGNLLIRKGRIIS